MVLIDADLRRPMLATIFERRGRSVSPRWLGATGRRCAAAHLFNRNLFTTAGRIPPNPANCSAPTGMNEVITELSRNNFVT